MRLDLFLEKKGEKALEQGLGNDGSVWSKYWDDEANCEFYYNEKTQESTYERPLNFETPRPADGQIAIDTGDGSGSSWAKYWDDASQREFYYNEVTQVSVYERPLEYSTPRPQDGQPPIEAGDNDWARYWDDESQSEFYYNNKTGESTFDRPREYYTPRPDENQAAIEDGEMGWAKYWDDSSQCEYYYNSQTGDSTYERPPTFVTPR